MSMIWQHRLKSKSTRNLLKNGATEISLLLHLQNQVKLLNAKKKYSFKGDPETVAKSYMMVQRCISAHGMDNLLAAGQTSSWKALLITARQCQTRFTTSWLCTKMLWILNWLGCSPTLSPVENIWLIMKRKNMTTVAPGLFSC